MQKHDVDIAAQLFEAANENADEQEDWTSRYEEHIRQTLRKHAELMRTSTCAIEKKLEIFRARLELNEVVADRLESRASRLDPGLAETFHKLRAENSAIIQRVFEEQGSGGRVGSSSPRLRAFSSIRGDSGLGLDSGFSQVKTAKRFGGGVSAFAAAATARQSSPLSSPREVASVALDLTDSKLQSLSTGMESISYNLSPSLLTSPRGRAQAMEKKGGYANIHRSHVATVVASRPAKAFNLMQLKDMMQSVYRSKAEHDQRCDELQEPHETLEKHLYSFLSKRYKLKSVVQEWAMTIFRSIQRYATKEVEVVVFGKVLQCVLSETFVTVQDTLRDTVQMLLREKLQKLNPQSPPSELDALWRARLGHGVPLAECEDVVAYMYNGRDCAVLLQRLHSVADAAEENRDPEARVIKYRDMVQTLMRFQMELTEAFLGEFAQIFRETDTDNDGILVGRQILDLIHDLATMPDDVHPSAEGIAMLMDAETSAKVQMQHFVRATFTDCADHLTTLISARWSCIEDHD